MGDNGDLSISKESLNLITKGLNDAIGELKESGSSATDSLQGSGFDGMSMTTMEAGGNGLAGAFEGFCENWEWGVRALVQDANDLAARLGLAAGMLWSEDQYWQGAFKVGLNSLMGNPHATEEEVIQQGYMDILKPDAPDYSMQSFEDAGDEMAQTWKDTGRSLVTEGQGGMQADLMNDLLGVDDQAFDGAVDETFGPSPEERAQQQAQQQGGQPNTGGEN